MKFNLAMECDNAAFEENAVEEISRILQELCRNLEAGRMQTYLLYDINGNLVGTAEI